MGFKLVEAVYRLDRNATTPSEQAVLLALAFRANDKTLLCYPKQETLVEMTHLSRATVAIALNALRQKGFLDWKSGGPSKRRGKYGQVLANDYTLKLQARGEKSKISDEGHVQQSDMAMSSHKTRPCPAAGHSHVRQSDIAMSGSQTPTENTTGKTSEITSPIPNRNDSGSESDFDKALRSMGIGVPSREGAGMPPHSQREVSPLLMALEVCGLAPGTEPYRANYRTFSGTMLRLGMERSMEIVRTFASELRQGEMDGIRNLPALLMKRLQQNCG